MAVFKCPKCGTKIEAENNNIKCDKCGYDFSESGNDKAIKTVSVKQTSAILPIDIEIAQLLKKRKFSSAFEKAKEVHNLKTIAHGREYIENNAELYKLLKAKPSRDNNTWNPDSRSIAESIDTFATVIAYICGIACGFLLIGAFMSFGSYNGAGEGILAIIIAVVIGLSISFNTLLLKGFSSIILNLEEIKNVLKEKER